MFKVYAILSLVLGFLIFAPAQAGCPQDVENIYGITNMSCEGDCKNWFVRNSWGEPATYFYKNIDNCTVCNVLSMHEMVDTWRGNGVQISGMEMVAGVGQANILQNGQPLTPSNFINRSKNGSFPKDTYDLKYGEHHFTFNLESENGLPKVENFTCVEGCAGIKILSDGSDKVRYDGCGDPAQHCNAAVVSNYPQCGSGYLVQFEYYPQGVVRPHDAAASAGSSFRAEDMQDSMSLSTKIGQAVFTYDLVKNEPRFLEKMEKGKQIIYEKTELEKEGSLNRVMAFVLAGIGLLAILFLLCTRLKSKIK